MKISFLLAMPIAHTVVFHLGMFLAYRYLPYEPHPQGVEVFVPHFLNVLAISVLAGFLAVGLYKVIFDKMSFRTSLWLGLATIVWFYVFRISSAGLFEVWRSVANAEAMHALLTHLALFISIPMAAKVARVS